MKVRISLRGGRFADIDIALFMPCSNGRKALGSFLWFAGLTRPSRVPIKRDGRFSQAFVVRPAPCVTREIAASSLGVSRVDCQREAALTWIGEWRLPGPERRAARSERAAERQMHRERDNAESAAIRAAALEAEARRDRNFGGMI